MTKTRKSIIFILICIIFLLISLNISILILYQQLNKYDILNEYRESIKEDDLSTTLEEILEENEKLIEINKELRYKLELSRLGLQDISSPFIQRPLIQKISKDGQYSYFSIEKNQVLSKKKNPTKYRFNVENFNEGDNVYTIKPEKYYYKQIFFSMSGERYNSGIIFDPAENGGYVTCKLENKYSKISFIIGHVDGTDLYAPSYKGKTVMRVYYNGDTLGKDYYEMGTDAEAEKIFVPLNYCDDFKIQMIGGGGLYAITDIILED